MVGAHVYVCVCVCVCVRSTRRAGNCHNPAFSLSEKWQEGPGDGKCSKEVNLHASSVVGHQRDLSIPNIHTHASVINKPPQI